MTELKSSLPNISNAIKLVSIVFGEVAPHLEPAQSMKKVHALHH